MPPHHQPNSNATAFLAGGGNTAQLIAQLDWSQTHLGSIESWPNSLRTAVGLALRSPAAIVLLLGVEGIMVYNDAYAVVAGDQHPFCMGAKVRECWPAYADFNSHVIDTVLAGGTLTYEDQELALMRNNRLEQAWLTLHYSALMDDLDQPMGVMAVVLETTGKVRTQNWLKNERERMRQMFEQAPGFMAMLLGPTHIFDLVNPAYMQLIGHRDVLGLTVREALPDIDGQGYYELLDTVFSTGEAFSGTSIPVTLQRTPGAKVEQRFVDLVYQPVRDPAGQMLGIFVQGSDVTERQLAVRAREENADQFRTFAQAQPNQIWTSPANGMLDWFSDRVYEYSGMQEGELDGQSWAQIVHPDDIPKAAAQWLECLKTGAHYDTEFRIRRKDGAFRWHLVRALPLRGPDGQINRWVGTNTDIHEHKLLEAESTRDRNRIWTLSRELMLICDANGIIAAVNPASVPMLGWTEEEMVGRSVTEFHHPDDRKSSADERLKLVGGLSTPAFENRYRTKSGEYRTLNWTAVPDGDRIHAIARDVTPERMAEDALRQAQKMEALGQLTGGIAHDFNNILQGIMGNVAVVKKLIANNRTAEVGKFVDSAINSTKRAAALTHRLLAYSRRQPLEPRTVDVNPLVASMEDLFQRTLGESIRIEMALGSDLWRTKCDPNQLENALLNLVINSRDAMPDGGVLTLETRNAALDGVLTTGKEKVQPGHYVCIAVSDTGTGMTQDTLSKAFDPFFTTKPIGQGTGLGLSMIYGFTRQSEGHVNIYSELGKGTTVKLYLPQVTDAAPLEDPEPSIVRPVLAFKGGTVAVVEDDAVVRELIVQALQESGYRVLQASDGTTGLRLLQSEEAIDLLLTDVGLPGLNGRQLADACRTQRPNMKVLFMTGYAENAVFTSGFLDAGMYMITKPFAMDLMLSKVQQLMVAGAV